MDRIEEDRICIPRQAATTVWLATSEGLAVIDMVAVERAAKGQRQGWTLTDDEARYTAQLLLDHQVPYSVVSARVGRSTATLRKWFPGQVAPSAPSLARPRPRGLTVPVCGTRKGYDAHRRRGEAACPACRAANSAADRYYRTHGTYVGAPEVAA
ncbi:hypothetical protein [Streptomyces sp. NPDC050388]|uniref:hypothetical protein n=1 Tax=Streptomyces sp. NPDC050388 TaxID=3155781 RepID=UPI0034295A29